MNDRTMIVERFWKTLKDAKQASSAGVKVQITVAMRDNGACRKRKEVSRLSLFVLIVQNAFPPP